MRRSSQVRAPQGLLSRRLYTVELQIDLQPARAKESAQSGGEFRLVRQSHAVRVQQQIFDPDMVARPFDQFKELRMQRRLAAGELEDFNRPLAVNDALNARLQFRK